MNENDVAAIFTTLKLAGVTTIILILIGTPLSWWLSQTHWKYKVILEALVAMPLVLPPSVLGFYLLIFLGPEGPLGRFMDWIGGQSIAFTFEGLVFGSVIYSMPFVVQPLQNAFSSIGSRPLEVAATLRASPLDRFFSVAVPMARNGFLSASVLGFAHTIGEFGVVLMIGGNIPGETRVLSISIYDHVEMLSYDSAHLLSKILLIFSFVLLVSVYSLNRHFSIIKGK